jgi:hypothetical protein
MSGQAGQRDWAEREAARAPPHGPLQSLLRTGCAQGRQGGGAGRGAGLDEDIQSQPRVQVHFLHTRWMTERRAAGTYARARAHKHKHTRSMGAAAVQNRRSVRQPFPQAEYYFEPPRSLQPLPYTQSYLDGTRHQKGADEQRVGVRPACQCQARRNPKGHRRPLK